MPAPQRRDQLLDAALAIIARDGYAAVSIEAIARELDVTRPVVYNNFAGLDELLYALLDRQEKRALDRLLAAIATPPDPHDLGGYLARTIRELVSVVGDDPLTWGPIFLAPAGTPAAVRDRIDRDREVVRARIRSIIELAPAAHGTQPGIDADIVAHAVVAIGEYFARLALSGRDAVDPDRLARTVGALLAPVLGRAERG